VQKKLFVSSTVQFTRSTARMDQAAILPFLNKFSIDLLEKCGSIEPYKQYTIMANLSKDRDAKL